MNPIVIFPNKKWPSPIQRQPIPMSLDDIKKYGQLYDCDINFVQRNLELAARLLDEYIEVLE